MKATLQTLFIRFSNPVVLGLCVILFGAVILFPGLGKPGLTDPWEMRQAHTARTMMEPPVLLVMEPRVKNEDLSEGTYRLSDGIREEFGESLEIVDPEVLGVGAPFRTGKTSAKTLILQAKRYREARIVHGFVLDAGLWVGPEFSEKKVDALVKEVAEIAKSYWQSPLFLVSSGDDDVQKRLAQALEERWTLAAAMEDDEAGLIPMPRVMDVREQKTLLTALEDFPGHAASRAWFLKDGQLETMPYLESWLIAQSFSVFGFSEWSARLPGAVLGVLLLGLLFVLVYRLWGSTAAVLSVGVLGTSPFFVMQGRSVTGDMAYTFFLLLSLGAFALSLQRNKPTLWWLALLLGWVGLLFSVGLFGVLASVLTIVLYGFVTLDRRAAGAAWLGSLLLVVVSVLVLLPEQWTFMSHFTFMQTLFGSKQPVDATHFDYVIKQVGFGLFPWIAFLPFAFARLFPWRGDKEEVDEESQSQGAERERRIWLLLFFAVPLLLTMFGLKNFGHMVFPATPAIAIAIALLLKHQWQGKRLGGGFAFLLCGMLLILWRELRKDVVPIFAAAIYDPPLGGIAFPTDVEAGTLFALCGALVVLSFAVFHGKWISLGRRILSAVRRGPLLHWVFTASFVMLGLQLVFGFMVRYAEAMNTVAGRELAHGLRIFPVELLRRPEHLLGLVALGVTILVALFRETPVGPWMRNRMPRVLGSLASRVKRGWDKTQLGHFGRYSTWVLVAGIAAFVDGLVRLPFPAEGFGVGTTFYDPAVWGLLFGLGLFASGISPGGKGPLARALRRVAENRGAWSRLALGATLLYVTLRLSKEVWFVPPELWIPVGVAGALSLVHLLVWCGGSRGRWVLLAAGILGPWAMSMLIPLLHKWQEVGPLAYPDGHEWMVPTAFGKTRLTLLGYGLTGFLGLNGLWGARGVLFRELNVSGARKEYVGIALLIAAIGGILLATIPPLAGAVVLGSGIAILLLIVGASKIRSGVHALLPLLRRGLGGLEDGKVLLVVAGGLSLVLALGYGHRTVPALAVHMSQKHVISTYEKASEEEPNDGFMRLFRYGSFGDGGTDYNFYTQQVQEVKDQGQMLDLLSGKRDVVLPEDSAANSKRGFRLVRVWDPANDQDGDGKRDQKAWAGLIEAKEEGWLEDSEATWVPDEWKGYSFFDASGRGYPVMSNTVNRLQLEGKPKVPKRKSAKSRYSLDSTQSSNHLATAMESSRVFFLLERGAFSRLNYQFRKKAAGKHIPVLDDRSSQLLLASSEIRGDETSANEIEKVTLREEQLEELEGLQRASVQLDDSLEIVGYRLAKEVFKRKEELQVEFFYRVKKTLKKDYQVFMHIERPGTTHRIHGDHFIMNRSPDGKEKKCVGCYQTKHWMEGDIIVDAYKREIPSSTPSGTQEMWMGFYNPRDEKRMRVKEFDKKVVRHDGKNRVMLGTFRVR